jgi:prevent-host-death family protein
MGAREARNRFADLLGSVRYGGQVVIVERAGQPMAVVIPMEMYERLVAEREARFQVLDRVRERLPQVPDEEVEADVAEAVGAVRAGHVAGRP